MSCANGHKLKGMWHHLGLQVEKENKEEYLEIMSCI